MKTALRMACVLLMILALPPVKTTTLSAESILSDSAILIEAESGQVLYDKNGYTKSYPASTTKIMTALLVSESCDPDDSMTVSQSALEIDEWNSANISLSAGERLTVNDALYALMLPSANDAANALAEYAAGSQERFVEMMNHRAWRIGARNTRFENAHGLHEPGHYTTSYDMALITREAYQNPIFMKYFGADVYTMPPTNRQPSPRVFTNLQYMLVKTTGYYSPDVIGGKVGFTNEAQHTMSTIASRNGRTLICVVMHSGERSQKFADTSRLLEYGFNEFREITLSAADFAAAADQEENAALLNNTAFTALLRNDIDEDEIEIRYEAVSGAANDGAGPLSTFQVLADTDDETLPKLLGEYPAASAPQGEAIKTSLNGRFPQETRSVAPSPLLVTVIVLSFVFVLLLILVLLRYRAVQKRRRERARMLNQRMRAYRKATFK